MKASRFTKIIGYLVLSSLPFLSACATGGGQSGYYPSVYQEQEQDPYFWRMWQDQRGIGG
jgi:hypothetical protein